MTTLVATEPRGRGPGSAPAELVNPLLRGGEVGRQPRGALGFVTSGPETSSCGELRTREGSSPPRVGAP